MQIKKIALIRPPFIEVIKNKSISDRILSSIFKPKGYEPPLGLGYLSAVLEKNGFSVEILDGQSDVYTLDSIRAWFELKKPDIVGVTCLSYDRYLAYKICALAKNTGAYTIIGGPHVTFTDMDVLKKFPYIDTVVRGEGEQTILELMNCLERGERFENIQGISYRADGQVVRNSDRELIKNLDEIPFPAWHLFPIKKYMYHPVIGSRGCPNNCIYCSSPAMWRRKVRFRSAINIVDEIEFVIKNYGKKIVHFKDDTLLVNKKWAIEICDEIIKRGLDIEWKCLGRVDNIDQELLQKLKRAGCKKIDYGIESGNENILENIKKRIDKGQAKTALKLTRDFGLNSTAYFMLGHPSETVETLNDTFNFAHELRSKNPGFSVVDILPGTYLFEVAKANGVLPRDFNWEEYPGVPPYSTKSLPKDYLDQLSDSYQVRLIFLRLFDLRSMYDMSYTFLNPHILTLLTKALRRGKINLLHDMIWSYKHSTKTPKKVAGAILLPVFITSLFINRLYYRSFKHYI